MSKLNKVLIVDDDEISNYITEMLLTTSGLAAKVEWLTNGRAAIEYFESTALPGPDLVLVDINMPLTNGFEFLEWMESNGFSGMTKFAMFSSSRREEDRLRSTQYSDVIDYIEKPLSCFQLCNTQQFFCTILQSSAC
jgi:CheY-like chemotaxis protein